MHRIGYVCTSRAKAARHAGRFRDGHQQGAQAQPGLKHLDDQALHVVMYSLHCDVLNDHNLALQFALLHYHEKPSAVCRWRNVLARGFFLGGNGPARPLCYFNGAVGECAGVASKQVRRNKP